MRCVETVIVGGGPAGAAAACGLAKRGREVMVVERTAAPHHKVCGEFLSLDTQALLHELGVDALALGAVPIERVAVCSSTRAVMTRLPFRALSLSRYRLDEALLRRAREYGAQLKRNVSVRRVTPDGAAWIVECGDGETLRCRHLVLATGKQRLRGVGDTRDNGLVGLKMHLLPADETRRALAGRVELAFLDDGYAGLELVENSVVNFCCVLPNAAVAGLAPGWPALRDYFSGKLPHLAERLVGAAPLWDKAVAVVCPTGGYLYGETSPAFYRVGDRLAHIPPFTGDGLAIALGTGNLAADHIGRASSPAAYLAAARALCSRAIRLAGVVSGLAATGAGRALLLGGAALMPGLIDAVTRHTRVPIATR